MAQSPHPAPRFLRFGAFTVDLQLGELRKYGTRIRLQEQPFQVLAMLMERPGDLVTREELRQRLWPADTFVDFDHGLNAAISRLRDALNDSAEKPRYIETIPRRGYRFIDKIEVTDPAPKAVQDPVPPQAVSVHRHFKPAWLIAGFLVLLCVVGVALFVSRSRRSNSHGAPVAIRSIAVLPLANLSGDPSQDYFAEGMTDELISDLAQVSALRVISRTSVMQYKNARKPLRDIGKDLSVDAIVEGTVERSGGRVRISAQLIQAATDTHLWAKTYERDLGDVLALQDEVAAAIAREIRVQLLPSEQQRLTRARAVNPDAYEAYLRGLYHINKRTQPDLEKSTAYFQQAVQLDPEYALAYAGLADSYALRGSLLYMRSSPQDLIPKSKTAARKALEIDPSLGEAHATLAYVETLYDWDWATSSEDFKRAIELAPNYAQAHLWYAMHLAAIGQSKAAIAEVMRARELDPLSPIINTTLGLMLYFDNQYEKAVDQFHRVLDLNPDFYVAHWELGLAYEQQGKYEKARSEFQKARSLSPANTTILESIGEIDAFSGHKDEARKILDQLTRLSTHEFVSTYVLAELHLALGNKDEALNALEKACAERDSNLIYVNADPALSPLHSDPRFQNLIKRIGLATNQ